MIMGVVSGNAGSTTITDEGGGSWTALTNSPASTSGTATVTNLSVFTDYYNGSQTAPTVTGPGNHCVGRIISITGARSGDEPSFGGVTADMTDVDLDTTITFVTGLTTSDNDCLIVLCAGGHDDSPTFGATWTNANLANISVRVSDGSTMGNDSAIEIVTGELATAGAVGTFTNTYTGANGWAAALAVAIRPPAAGGAATTMTIITGGF